MQFNSTAALRGYLAHNPHIANLTISDSPKLRNLPALPGSITSLRIENCHNIALGPLPPALGSLEIVNCLIPYLPAQLPSALAVLRVVGTNMVGFPVLPPNLTNLIIVNCPHMRDIPSLPETIIELTVIDCPLVRTIPRLPESLQYLEYRRDGQTESGVGAKILPLVDPLQGGRFRTPQPYKEIHPSQLTPIFYPRGNASLVSP